MFYEFWWKPFQKILNRSIFIAFLLKRVKNTLFRGTIFGVKKSQQSIVCLSWNFFSWQHLTKFYVHHNFQLKLLNGWYSMSFTIRQKMSFWTDLFPLYLLTGQWEWSKILCISTSQCYLTTTLISTLSCEVFVQDSCSKSWFFVKKSIFDLDFLLRSHLVFSFIYVALKSTRWSTTWHKNILGTHMGRWDIDQSFSKKMKQADYLVT